ncbi:hypothetical protein OB986_20290 [Bacillus cereus]|nr:hypothetical protein [Bacillus cereus]
MSVDLQILIDSYIDKRDIEEILFSMGFKKEKEHNNIYFWFDEDFVSIRGCWFRFSYDLEVFYEGKDRTVKTVCTTSTNAGRSYADFQMQIDTIKKIEEVFGGSVYADGEYGYFENDVPKLSKTELACGHAYVSFESNLTMVKELIEEVDSRVLMCIERGIPPIYDKNLWRNNTLLPFFVSIMENFLKTFLYNYIRTNQEAENLIFKKKDKLPYSVVRELLNNEKTIIDVEMESYSFQNFKSANIAYTQFVKVDLFKDILSIGMEIDGKEVPIVSTLSELLEKRHKLIHEAELDYTLDKNQMKKYYNCLIVLKNTFAKVFKEKKNIRIDLENEI